MIDQIDGHYIAAQVRLNRQVNKSAVIIVEGEKDERIFKRFFDSSASNIEIAFGKGNLLEALDILEEDGFPGVLAIADADFDRLLSVSRNLNNLYLTDHHDIDVTIFLSEALPLYLGEHGDEKKISAEFGGCVDALRAKLAKSILYLSCARLLSRRRSLDIYFKDIRYEEYIDPVNLNLDKEKLAKFLFNRSRLKFGINRLKQMIDAEESAAPDLYEVTNGHDLMAVFGIALQNFIGNRRVVHTWRVEVESGMRLAFDLVCFRGGKLHAGLCEWERSNVDYRLFHR